MMLQASVGGQPQQPIHPGQMLSAEARQQAAAYQQQMQQMYQQQMQSYQMYIDLHLLFM